MPFSRENIRFTLLVIGFVCVFSTAVSSMAAIAYSKNPNSTPILTAVIGFCSIQILQLVLLLRQEQNARQQQQETAKTRHDIKGEIQPMALGVEEALKHGGEPCYKKEEMQDMVREVLREAGYMTHGAPPAKSASESPPTK